jgi:hypothetical protein
MTTQPPMKDPSVLSVFIGVYRWSISKKTFFYQAQGILRLHIQFTSGVNLKFKIPKLRIFDFISDSIFV